MPSSPRQAARSNGSHKWTQFELDIVLSLICKHEHIYSTPLTFATKLNEALNGSGSCIDYDDDIPVEDVRALLAHIEKEKKGPLNVIERQPAPHRITRMKKRVFARNISFTGSKAEWLAGRRCNIAAQKQQGRNVPGSQMTFTNGQGVQIERWVPDGGSRSGVSLSQSMALTTTQPLPLAWINQDSMGMTPAWGDVRNIGTTPAWDGNDNGGRTPAWNHHDATGGTSAWNPENTGNVIPAYGPAAPPGLMAPPFAPLPKCWGAPAPSAAQLIGNKGPINALPHNGGGHHPTRISTRATGSYVLDSGSGITTETTRAREIGKEKKEVVPGSQGYQNTAQPQ